MKDKIKLEQKICTKIEEFNSYLERDQVRVCTKSNLIPLKNLIDSYLTSLENEIIGEHCGRCVFCNNEITSYHESKKPTLKQIDAEHYFRNMNQKTYSISEINFNDRYAHKYCKPNKRNWHKSDCHLFKKYGLRKNGKCNCGCNKEDVER